MPHTSSTHNIGNQNEHYHSGHGLSQQQFDFKNSNSTSSQSEEWSFLTKELIDTLPRIWTRGLLYLLIVFAAFTLPWAMLSKVDETGSARGRLEPKGKTIKLDAPVAGEVAAIKVKEGQKVKAGQTLLLLKSDIALAELQQARANLAGQLNRLPLLEVLKKQQQMSTRTQQMQNLAQASAQLAQINQIRQQLSFHKTESDSAQQLLAKDRDTIQRFRSLQQKGIVSALQVDDAERRMIENKQRLQKAQSDIKQNQTELKKQQRIYESTLHQGELAVMESDKQIEQIQSQIAILTAEIAQTRNQIQSLLFQLRQRELHAPTDGTVFQLPVRSVGVVLQPGEMIAQIAPKGTSLVLKAKMASPESGFLRVGLPVKVKFDAYPFQDYGVVSGRLSWISPDTKIQKTAQGEVETFEPGFLTKAKKIGV